MDLVALAIPAFLVLIGVEIAVARLTGQAVHRPVDAMTDLSCGIGSQVVGLALKAATVGLYTWVWARFGLLDLGPDSPWAWLLGFLAVDLAYYVWHRASHEVAFLWAAHVVHHQSEDYNLAVALRQAWFTGLTSIPFYLPLAVLGLHPAVWLTHMSISLLYQFWIHTRLIRSLGPLEAVLNTPSHHRVHHGINPRYLDRNHGGILIVWDRLFGTFTVETEPVVYGTVRPTRSFNPVWANFDVWAHLFEEARRTSSWADALRVFLGPPGWRPADRPPSVAPEVSPDTFVKYEAQPPLPMLTYGVVQFAPLIPLVSVLLASDAGPTRLAALGAFVVATTLTVGGLFEDRGWAGPLERLRLLTAPAVALLWGLPGAVVAGIAVASVSSAILLSRISAGAPSIAARPR